MAESTANTIRTIGIIVTVIVAIASPIIAVTKVTTSNGYIAKAASGAYEKATSAKELAEKNARDFEYFKGEMTATMKAHKDSLDNTDDKIDKLNVKIDEMLKIIVRFKRADD